MKRTYDTDLNWCEDKRVRDTGPYVKDVYYGTHTPVRMFYSPRMMFWLTGKTEYWSGAKAAGYNDQPPRHGQVPEGAMVVKEMFYWNTSANLYKDLKKMVSENKECSAEYKKLVDALISSWVVMIKTNETQDGWYYGGSPNISKTDTTINQVIETHLDKLDGAPWAGYGLACIRCHASATDDEMTFSDLANVKGFAEDENLLTYRDDNSWREEGLLDTYPLSKIKKFAQSNDCLDETTLENMFELNKNLLPSIPEECTYSNELYHHGMPFDPAKDSSLIAKSPLKSINHVFAQFFHQEGINTDNPKKFPNEWSDHVPAGKDLDLYITSDNCLGCHGGLAGGEYDVAMFIKTGKKYGDGFNVSEYGEWRWSPMGLAGRDPIFYSQLESEMAYINRDSSLGGLLVGSAKANQHAVTNLCTSCHGSMGERQLKIDARTDSSLDSNFNVDYVYLKDLLSSESAQNPPAHQKYAKYGMLAREGISCLTCHHIEPPSPGQITNWVTKVCDDPKTKGWIVKKSSEEVKELAYLLAHNTTGRFYSTKPDEVNGPLDDVYTYPMENGLGIKPNYNEFISDSKMCGTCHTINLPNIGVKAGSDLDKHPILTKVEPEPALKPYGHSIEQATFLEWQNSIFGREGKEFQSCQDCHMPGGFQTLDGSIDIDQIVTKIATIQDMTYPQTANMASEEQVGVTMRDNYKRHEHVGLNVFLLEMFNQFPDILGVKHTDYMTSADNGNRLAIENMVRQAREATVDLQMEVNNKSKASNRMDVDVTVTNLTGHRIPSGVAFRRAFLEVQVINTANNQVVWGSGRTNTAGVIVDSTGQALKTEFLPNKETYQKHHTLISNQSQVQIYEELNQNAQFEFTTSFVHRVHPIKDNRLLPSGWLPSDAPYFKKQGEVIVQFMEATDPGKYTRTVDKAYTNPDNDMNFVGHDKISYKITLPDHLDRKDMKVQVTMYSQAIPPYWLNHRFEAAPTEPATQRLYYIASHLNTQGTAIEDWKLRLVSKHAEYDSHKGAWLTSKAPEPEMCN